MVALASGAKAAIANVFAHFVLLFELQIVRQIESFGSELYLFPYRSVEEAPLTEKILEELA